MTCRRLGAERALLTEPAMATNPCSPSPISAAASAGSPDGRGPRYLRFARALLLGSAIAAAPVAAGGCGDMADAAPHADAMGDADATVDAGPVAVDGPLAPPDLPKAAA